MTLRVYLTGPLRLQDDAKLLAEKQLGGRQGLLLVTYLVGERARLVMRDELADELWPESPPATWDRTLNALISRVRTVLAPCEIEIKSGSGGYTLRLPSDSWVDTEAAPEALDAAEGLLRKGDFLQAFGHCCVAYYVARRPFLHGCEGPWATRRRGELRELLIRANECLGETWLLNNEPQLAVKHATDALQLEPFRERGYQLLMRGHAASGNRAEALRAYDRLRKLLDEELGVPPSAETEAVFLQILQA